MSRRPIEPGVDAGRAASSHAPGVPPAVFREALSHWASTVTVVAVRDDGDVQAITVTSFMPVSAEPPRILVSVGPNARILPFLDEGGTFAVSLLAAGQRRTASDFADSFPVGPRPFPPEGPPVVEGAVTALVCTVHRMLETEDRGRLVLARVDEVVEGSGEPLLYHRRRYRTPGGE